MVMSTPFTVIPAIDLRGGKVVRLRQGDFSAETTYGDDPTAIALEFAAQGARWLHVVDLDGARTGSSAHGDAISRIVAAVGGRVAVEVAGGLRSLPSVEAAFAGGAARAVVGTTALDDPSFAKILVQRFGADRIAVSLDVRDGVAVGRGWVPGTAGTPVGDAVAALEAAGVEWVEVTAIERDGTLDGPDLDLLRSVIGASRARVIAAGGIGSVEDVRAVRAVGCAGAIVGRALYDGTLSLAAALGAPSDD